MEEEEKWGEMGAGWGERDRGWRGHLGAFTGLLTEMHLSSKDL